MLICDVSRGKHIISIIRLLSPFQKFNISTRMYIIHDDRFLSLKLLYCLVLQCTIFQRVSRVAVEEAVVHVVAEEYLNRLADHSCFKTNVLCTVLETGQVFCEQEDFRLCKPELELDVRTTCSNSFYNLFVNLVYVNSKGGVVGGRRTIENRRPVIGFIMNN